MSCAEECVTGNWSASYMGERSLNPSLSPNPNLTSSTLGKTVVRLQKLENAHRRSPRDTLCKLRSLLTSPARSQPVLEIKRERQRLAVGILGQQSYDSKLPREEPEITFGHNMWSHRTPVFVLNCCLHMGFYADVGVVVCCQWLERWLSQ